MARRRRHYNRTELNHVTIGLICLACSVNGLLGALVMHTQARAVAGLLIWSGLTLVTAGVCFFSNPFRTGRPLTTMIDMITVAVVLLALHGHFIWKCWPLAMAVALEAVLIIRFYRNNRPQRR